ncbi:MAG: hypothetical protein DRN88_01885 [Candidatus Hydrothermarchaeota archaeon]|nr:MAG: hypothetical protein DRN88_01885 [Candidatus Hydrothermarchaeota archaeon]
MKLPGDLIMHRSNEADVVALAGTGVKKLYIPEETYSPETLFHFLPVFIKVRLYDKEIKIF